MHHNRENCIKKLMNSRHNNNLHNIQILNYLTSQNQEMMNNFMFHYSNNSSTIKRNKGT